jgi:acetyltransferase-like isoleucine patch superfamily enzyme
MGNIINYIKRWTVSRKLDCGYVIYFKDRITIIGSEHVHFGKNFTANEDVKIEAWEKHGMQKLHPDIYIGDNVFMNCRTHISATQKLVIGNGVLMGSDIFISDNNHGKADRREELMVPPAKRDLYSKGPIVIQDNVWIGDKAIVLGNVTIGEGAIIGASAVVTKDIPAYSIAVGCPAKVIRRL